MEIAASRGDSLVHEAFIYSSDHEFVAAVVPFVREGLALGQPTVAVLPDAKATLLREALDEDARLVSFVDAITLYRSPANAISEYRRRVARRLVGTGSEPLRIIAEAQFETSGREHDEWVRYESAINAVGSGWPTWFVCLYDTRTHPEHIIADVERTHPLVRTAAGAKASATYCLAGRVAPGAARTRVGCQGLRAPPPVDSRDRGRSRGAASCRYEEGRAAGLPAAVVADVTVAVNELVREALACGAPSARVQIGRSEAQWLCEITYEADSEAAAP